MNHSSWIIIADDAPPGSLPLLAREIGGTVTAVVAGDENRAKEVASFGVDSVIWYPVDDSHPAEAWAYAVAKRAVQEKPRVILSANLPVARVLLGAAAAQLKASVVSSLQSVSVEADRIVVSRMVADARAVEILDTTGSVAGIVIEGGEESERTEAKAEVMSSHLEAADESLQVVSVSVEHGGADLSSAERVVSMGAGIGSKENIELVKKLADVLQAEIACSLPLCDNYRWFDASRVVGSSTQKISPRIYLMIGISGQPQHMTGVRGAKTIIAVNNDPDAPVFKKCHYGIVGDLNKIVPALTEALKGCSLS